MTDLPLGFPPELDQAIRQQAARIIALDPPDPDYYETNGMLVGVFYDTPSPEAVRDECDHCGALITIGPNQQVARNLRPSLKPICVCCVVAVFTLSDSDEYNVHQAKDLLGRHD